MEALKPCLTQSDHVFVREGDVDRCYHCGVSWVDSVKGFGMNQTKFSMPPTKKKRTLKGLSE